MSTKTQAIREAIAQADAELNNVGIPTYSELLGAALVVIECWNKGDLAAAVRDLAEQLTTTE